MYTGLLITHYAEIQCGVPYKGRNTVSYLNKSYNKQRHAVFDNVLHENALNIAVTNT